MSIQNILYKIKLKIRLQFLRQSWLNLKKDRAKALFAMGGITVSIILLTAIGMINDSMSYNYMGIITSTTGSSDIIISKTVKTDLTFDPFFDETLIDNELSNIEGVDELFPRIMMLVKVSSDNTDSNGSLQVYGIDFLKEASNGQMGNLNLVDQNGTETGSLYVDEPNMGECVILWKVAELLNVSIGDLIHINYQQYTLDVEVVAICRQELKFTELENALIIINLEQAQSFMQREGEINLIMGTIENPQSIYVVSDIDFTLRKIREIGTRIQQRLDPNVHTVSMPKLEEISAQQFLLISMTIIFWFITIISMLITGILINSILSTSTEERIREYGILRVVGGKKMFPVKMVIFEGAMIGVVGSIIGIIVGLIGTPPIVGTLFALTDFPLQNMDFVIQPQTVILAFCIGSIVSLVVSLFPALRTAKIDIIKSITPFHKKEEGWEVKKEGSMNVRSFLIGSALATIGMIVFILLPSIFVSGEMMMIAGLFIGLIAAILIGMVFASVGIIPIIQSLLIGAFTPMIKKYAHIIKISLKRNRRRNTSTIVMFAISFSFIFFITSVSEMQSKNMSINLRFQYGSDLVLINQGINPETNAITLDTIQELNNIDGIDEIAISLYNMFDITSVLSVLFDFSEGGGGFDEDSINDAFLNIFEFYTKQAEEKYQVKAGDLVNFDNIEVGFIGIEKNYYKLMDNDLMIWSSPRSGFNYSFSQVFNENNTCIIAKSLATIFGIDDIGQYIRLTFYNPQITNDPGNITLFRVVGISGGMPGFSNFRTTEATAEGGGIMVSLENYMRLMNVKDQWNAKMVVDKAFIKLKDDSEVIIEDTKEDVRDVTAGKDYFLDDAITKVIIMQSMFERQSSLMEVVLWFAIVIAIFGLVSTMYAIMLERKFEIGILRSMGMKTRNVRNLFLVESLIIMLSSGTMGTLIGTYCAYLMETNLGLITEMPIVFSIPLDVLFRVFSISIFFGILGMYLILIKLSRQSVMDIFRQTF
ncbi:MAG TPA: FtsX-like permease family protein [Candidatus Nanopelagicaceae bacterium]|nr:FtsX-like permease family protein [Candidatus Nanopelagicaceae bacterium]